MRLEFAWRTSNIKSENVKIELMVPTRYQIFLRAFPASSKVFLCFSKSASLALKSVYFKHTDKLFCQELKLFNENYHHLLI